MTAFQQNTWWWNVKRIMINTGFCYHQYGDQITYFNVSKLQICWPLRCCHRNHLLQNRKGRQCRVSILYSRSTFSIYCSIIRPASIKKPASHQHPSILIYVLHFNITSKFNKASACMSSHTIVPGRSIILTDTLICYSCACNATFW